MSNEDELKCKCLSTLARMRGYVLETEATSLGVRWDELNSDEPIPVTNFNAAGYSPSIQALLAQPRTNYNWTSQLIELEELETRLLVHLGPPPMLALDSNEPQTQQRPAEQSNLDVDIHSQEFESLPLFDDVNDHLGDDLSDTEDELSDADGDLVGSPRVAVPHARWSVAAQWLDTGTTSEGKVNDSSMNLVGWVTACRSTTLGAFSAPSAIVATWTSAAVGAGLNRLRRSRLLHARIQESREEIRELDTAQVIEKYTALRRNLTEANIRLAISRSTQWRGSLSSEETSGLAILGLVKSIDGFAPDVGTTLSTYAEQWIKQTVKRGNENCSSAIRIPVHDLLKLWTALAATRYLDGVEASSLTVTKLALLLEDHNTGIAERAQLLARPTILSDCDGLDSKRSSDSIWDGAQPTPWQLSVVLRQAAIIAQLMESFDKGSNSSSNKHAKQNPRMGKQGRSRKQKAPAQLTAKQIAVRQAKAKWKRDIAMSRLALGIQAPLTLQTLGVQREVTRERIRQIGKKTLLMLQHRLLQIERNAPLNVEDAHVELTNSPGTVDQGEDQEP